MSTISNIQSNGIYNFSIEKPTQSMQKKLLIEQSEHQGLKVSFADGAKVQPIERYMLDGLPKTSLVPQEFFDACHATLSEGGRVNFVLGLKGGMQSEHQDLIDTIRSNLENDYEERDLSTEEIELVMAAFTEVISKKTQEEQTATVEAQVKKFADSGKPELAKPFMFALERADGKYGFFGSLIFGVGLAKSVFKFGQSQKWW